ncbi:hypothetical protein WJX75_008610 [Coccomyxa subellipsoidea]|uniref:Uncharacterized protein n=1 Tax=Coccomyxa subellipsoidea TaxID=248742 RepID=A0ABR2YMP3_9CHLO
MGSWWYVVLSILLIIAHQVSPSFEASHGSQCEHCLESAISTQLNTVSPDEIAESSDLKNNQHRWGSSRRLLSLLDSLLGAGTTTTPATSTTTNSWIAKQLHSAIEP